MYLYAGWLEHCEIQVTLVVALQKLLGIFGLKAIIPFSRGCHYLKRRFDFRESHNDYPPLALVFRDNMLVFFLQCGFDGIGERLCRAR